MNINIINAIAQAQFDLGGAIDSDGLRASPDDPKMNYFWVLNFFALATGQKTKPDYLAIINADFAGLLTMSQNLVGACNANEKRSIRMILAAIIQRNKTIQEKFQSGNPEEKFWVKTLDLNNEWGRVVLALAESFRVPVAEHQL